MTSPGLALRKVFVIAACALSLGGCSRPGSKKEPNAAPRDSATSVDSTHVRAVVEQHATLTYEQRQGKFLYSKYCAICHGDGGKGDGFNAYSLDPKPRDFTDPRAMGGIDDAMLRSTISGGGKGVNKSPLMPAWGGRLDKQEMEYVVEYVKFLELQH